MRYFRDVGVPRIRETKIAYGSINVNASESRDGNARAFNIYYNGAIIGLLLKACASCTSYLIQQR